MAPRRRIYWLTDGCSRVGRARFQVPRRTQLCALPHALLHAESNLRYMKFPGSENNSHRFAIQSPLAGLLGGFGPQALH